MTVRRLIGLLPGWLRSRYALMIPLVLVVVPVAVSLGRDSHFDTTLEVLPTTPPGNAGTSSGELAEVRAGVNLVVNAGFEHDRSSWGDGPAFKALRSERLAHAGRASLRSSSDQPVASDTNAAHTYIVFPQAGTYRVNAWVYLPPTSRGRRPAVFLEGFSGSTQLAQRLARPGRRGTWQRISTDYVISPQDLEGSLVLRDLQGADARGRGRSDIAGGRVLYWDDISVTAPRPDPPSNALAAAAILRSALEEPQLRSDMARLIGDDNLYDPRRATVQRSAREDTLSFVISVANDLPSDANRLAGPLRSTLLDAARRIERRQAQRRWQQLIAIVGDRLPSRQRRLLVRRAKVLERTIGAQAADVVAPPVPVPEPSKLTPAQQLRIHEARQRIISRIADDLPPWQGALVRLEADNLQRMIAADTADFVVLPPDSPVRPTRLLDRLAAELPGPFPARVGPFSAATAGLMCAVLLLGMLITMTVTRHHAPPSRR